VFPGRNFSRKARCGKPGRRRRPMTYRHRHLRGSWGHAGRKPRVFRCLASETRHRENRGFLPACPCDPRRQAGAGGWRLLPIFRVLLFAHHHVNSTFSDLETPVAERPFCLRCRCRSATKVAKNKKRGRIFVVHQGNCFARPCSSRLERNAGVGTGSHFSATPTPTRPRAPQKRKPVTTCSPPPLL